MSFYINFIILAVYAIFTPFYIIYKRYLKFYYAVARPMIWYFILMTSTGHPALSYPQKRYLPDVCIFDIIS